PSLPSGSSPSPAAAVASIAFENTHIYTHTPYSPLFTFIIIITRNGDNRRHTCNTITTTHSDLVHTDRRRQLGFQEDLYHHLHHPHRHHHPDPARYCLSPAEGPRVLEG